MPKLTDEEEKTFLGSAYKLKTQGDTDAHYAGWSETYDKDLTELDYQQPKRCADAMLKAAVALDARILDIGCGTGLSGKALHQAGYTNIDGTDISEPMLEKAKALDLYRKLFWSDLNKPPIDVGDEAYDAIAVVGVFSFGHVMPDALDEILRVLKPGGILVIGLNQYFYDDSNLSDKLTELEEGKKIAKLDQQLGYHMSKTETKGWVITLRKSV